MKRIGRIFCSSFLSVLLVLSECPTVSAEDSKKEENVIEDIQRITEFVGYESNENKPYMNFMVNAEEKENLMLPESLDVWIENSSEPEKLMVNWDIKTETYDQIVYVPKWDEALYQLSDELLQGQDALPYIVVNVENQMQNNELIVYDNNVTEKTVGSEVNADYANFIELFNDSLLSGDVIVKLNSDVTESRNASTGAFEIPDRITSLTIDSNEENTLKVSGDGALSNIYANGKKLYVGKDIQISGSDIYGGGYEKDIIGSPEIVLDGILATGSIYGGGYNSNLEGNVKVTVNGKVNKGLVAGGGHAISKVSNVSADVNGSVSIVINKGAYVKSVNGGGYAQQIINGSSGYTLTAKVTGSIELFMDGFVNNVKAIIGGGVAEGKAVANTVINADVGQNITVTIGENGQGFDNNHIGFYGGGYADSGVNDGKSSNNLLVSARVGGNITIYADKDIQASISNGQREGQVFWYFYGGGFAAGRNADSTVVGNVNITISRPVIEAREALYGGGFASFGGTSDVNGKTQILVKPIVGQTNDFENTAAVYGGGRADGNYDLANQNLDLKVSQANVGGTEIKIMAGSTISEYETDRGVSIAGGGLANGNSTLTSYGETFDMCPAIAKVLGNISINIAEDIAFKEGMVGGGIVVRSGDASIEGSINIEIKDNCVFEKDYIGAGEVVRITSTLNAKALSNVEGNITSKFGKNIQFIQAYYGGGFTFGVNSYANVGGKITTSYAGGVSIGTNYVAAGYARNPDTTANVIGGLDYTINGDFSCGSYYGAGYLYNSANSADIGTKDNSVLVKTIFKGDGTNTMRTSNSSIWQYNGGYAQFGGGTVNVYGDLSLTFDGTIPQQTLIVGGYGNKTTNADITGNIEFTMQNLDDPMSSSIYCGGYAANGGTANITGNITTQYNNSTINGAVYGGGRNADATAGTNADITGNMKMIFTNTVLSSAYGGSMGADGNNAVINGTSIIELKAGNTVKQKLYAGGYYFSSLDNMEFHVTGIQKSPITFIGSGADETGVVNNDIKLFIGDGTTETTLNSLYLQNLDEVIVADKATLNLAEVAYTGGNNTNHLFYNVGDLTIHKGGTLDLTNAKTTYSDSILGNYTGGGTLRLEDGKMFAINGTASGTTIVEIDDTPVVDQTYITVAGGGTESFTYDSSEYELRNDEASTPHKWKYVKSEIVKPNNSVTGIVNDSEYTKGDKISFTAVGDGMDVTSPQTNAVRWLPVKWQVLTENSFNEAGPYTGEIDTSTLSVGSSTLKVVFQKQKYDGSVWNDVTGEDTLTITFMIKEKTSSDLPSGGGGGGGSAPSSKTDGFVVEKNKTYYYNNGKQVESGFILLDKDEKLVAAVKPEQLSVIPETAEAVYFIKDDRTVAKQEWVILDEFNNLVNTRPFDQLITDYGDNYKVYAAREDGRLVQSWLEVNGIWYYFKEDYTVRYQYWQAHWDDWYLFENYTYVTNRWQPTSEGRWYYLDSEGRMVRNQWIDGCWINEDGIYWSPLYN